MEATLTQQAFDSTTFREYVHVVWGYTTLIDRALAAAAEDPKPLVDAVLAVSARHAA